MLYATAYKFASTIQEQIDPLCDRSAIAGSIRRHSALCGDIDLVCQVSRMQRMRVRERCLRSHPIVSADGEHILNFRLANDVRVNVFFARPAERDLFSVRPSNWGSVLLCRTGCADFCRLIALRAADLGYHWDPFRGILLGEVILASESEEDIFKALRMRPVDPIHRQHVSLPEVAA